eukprot:CAMPEP_0198224730 /NCGR_PEP_ID=MMETSP1445-20131203/98111_1 /TAXON_ID=36898 /ORGANISM="Pyramimonas sp., Strain CCMP2087" /LENGTH=78 /DNA_ID=CAMNT_0043903985 /DNA_START=152 /DNA_END=385 /DNA_ORIENTATION=+
MFTQTRGRAQMSTSASPALCVIGTQRRGQQAKAWSTVRAKSTKSNIESPEDDDDLWGIKDLKEYTTLSGEHSVETEVK